MPVTQSSWALGIALLCGAATSSLERRSPEPSEMERLKFYIGDWSYSATYDKSSLFPNGGHNAGWWTSQWGPRHLSVVTAFEANGTVDNGAGMEVVRWDPKERIYRDSAIWFDKPGEWELLGHFEGTTLVYRADFDFEGHHVKFRSETRPSAAGGFAMDEYAAVDGKAEERILRASIAPR